ncbi:hemolysin family protein [Thermoleophilum album]|uniref:Hemolysin, contains CBS domains n=1 Tax=Thermoleophilum album TaxID=29539 RepID=A0A1H6FQJ9_THEAL|nr:hemolysin family protein [Thermoleophilum album]SEH12480.1 Hemolysin, contains CBS domains [Thermoleophilum album]
MTAVLLIAAVFALVALNGFFVAAEFALVRARQGRLEELAKAGSSGARTALRQLELIDQYLAACQLGITMTSIGIGFLGEPAVARLIEPLFTGALGHAVALGISVTLAYVLVTALHITLGEQVPKIYAIVHAERTAAFLARPLGWFNTLFRPAVHALNGASNAILRLLRVDPRAEFEQGITAEELKYLIVRGLRAAQLDPGEAGMLSGVFHLHEQQARHVMTPIPAVVTCDVSETAGVALRRCVDSGHTRLVVTEQGSTDKVRGVVHVNSLARRVLTEGPDAPIEGAIKDVLIVPETKPLDDLLADLQRERASMAVVIDEYGRTVGIVTVEDILEEIVGEIADETDPVVTGVRRLRNGDWWVRGHVPITDLRDYGIDLPIEPGEYNSIGGYVFGQLGRLPKRGDLVRIDGFSLRVESVRENRIEAVRIRDHRGEPPPSQERQKDDRNGQKDGRADSGRAAYSEPPPPGEGRPVERAAADPDARTS